MEWEEINRRLRNGTSVSVLAELAGTTYKNMYNRIRRREQIDGRQYLKPEQLKRPYKAQGGRKKAAFLEKKMHIPEEKKNVPDPGPAASNSSNVILCESCRHFCPGTETTRPYCKKYEHMCGLIYVCEGYAAGGPEVEPIGEEKAPARPEVMSARKKLWNDALAKYNCDTCANVIARPESYSCTDGHVEIEKYCTKGHEYGGSYKCCSDYVTSALEPFIKPPEEKPSGPEVEPIGEEKAPDVPEVVEKVADVPEVVREFAGIPEGVVKETLEKYKESHAAAVKQMHDIEDMYKEAKHTEMKIRAICVALERLLEGGGV